MIKGNKVQIIKQVIFIITGAIIVFLAIHHISDPIHTSDSFLGHLGISLLAIGGISIFQAISNKIIRKGIRAFQTSVGILAIMAGLYSIIHLHPQTIVPIWIVSLFFIVYGSKDVITGFTSRYKSKLVRIEEISVGTIILALTGVLVAYDGLSLTVIVILHSINLIIMGFEIIIAGIKGKKILKV